MSNYAQINVVGVGDERLGTNKHGGGWRRAIALESMRWEWNTGGYARIDTVGWKASGRARKGPVDAGDERLRSNGHG